MAATTSASPNGSGDGRHESGISSTLRTFGGMFWMKMSRLTATMMPIQQYPGGGYSPVAPSMRSRMKSAWPLWRAYSSIMCR